MTGRMKHALSLVTALFVGAVLGISILKLQLPPYQILADMFHQSVRPVIYRDDPVPAIVPHIRIASEEDVLGKRAEIIALLWPNGIPTRAPEVQDVESSHRSNAIERIERLIIQMDYGVNSIAYRFIPRVRNSHLVIYHRGHEGSTRHHDQNISRLIDQGFEVVTLWMPLTGENSRPWIDQPAIGRVQLQTHGHLQFAREGGHPIRLFVEPVVVALNYLAAHGRYRSISMMGLSGGGWTTTLAAAIDPRIKLSFPVAGSIPLSMRGDRDIGDYEQASWQLYSIANYFELYVMGASGEARRQVQVLNEFDPCCFSGRSAQSYANAISHIATGSFEVMIDGSHGRHEISKAAMAKIISEILG